MWYFWKRGRKLFLEGPAQHAKDISKYRTGMMSSSEGQEESNYPRPSALPSVSFVSSFPSLFCTEMFFLTSFIADFSGASFKMFKSYLSYCISVCSF